jgi:ADP-heptose:LPS heptosyltransferase
LEDGIVIDPDSRLTQLGLISVCRDRDYFFFDSRSFGGDGGEPLPVLAARWAHQVFGVGDAKPYIAPLPPSGPPADITVSLGVGENPAKRIGREFERDLLRVLAETGASVLVDLGGSTDERDRVERALLPGIRTHHGAFAPFAAQIARSRLFAGYDSAGGHVASACGLPLISIFGGFVSDRMFQRWRPSGTVIRADHPDVLGAVRRALTCTFLR